jgi:hypothetical protein
VASVVDIDLQFGGNMKIHRADDSFRHIAGKPVTRFKVKMRRPQNDISAQIFNIAEEREKRRKNADIS